MFHHAPVLVLGIGIGMGQYYWVLGALLGIVLTLVGFLAELSGNDNNDCAVIV